MRNPELYMNRLYSKDWAKRGRPDVMVWDVIPIAKEQLVKVTRISQNSEDLQNVGLSVNPGNGGVEVWGEFVKEGVAVTWDRGTPDEIIFKCTNDKGFLRIEGFHAQPHTKRFLALRPRFTRWYGKGMTVEERDGLRIYHCHNHGFDGDFDNLVFSVELLPPKE
ncbi:MAG: hypothetical protein M1319_03880 [Chloroflexi bacterium]|nr:hypothetical protein [Chloroflexota bacterium]